MAILNVFKNIGPAKAVDNVPNMIVRDPDPEVQQTRGDSHQLPQSRIVLGLGLGFILDSNRRRFMRKVYSILLVNICIRPE